MEIIGYIAVAAISILLVVGIVKDLKRQKGSCVGRTFPIQCRVVTTVDALCWQHDEHLNPDDIRWTWFLSLISQACTQGVDLIEGGSLFLSSIDGLSSIDALSRLTQSSSTKGLSSTKALSRFPQTLPIRIRTTVETFYETFFANCLTRTDIILIFMYIKK